MAVVRVGVHPGAFRMRGPAFVAKGPCVDACVHACLCVVRRRSFLRTPHNQGYGYGRRVADPESKDEGHKFGGAAAAALGATHTFTSRTLTQLDALQVRARGRMWAEVRLVVCVRVVTPTSPRRHRAVRAAALPPRVLDWAAQRLRPLPDACVRQHVPPQAGVTGSPPRVLAHAHVHPPVPRVTAHASPTRTGAGAYDGSFHSVLARPDVTDVSVVPSQNSRAVMSALRTLQVLSPLAHSHRPGGAVAPVRLP